VEVRPSGGSQSCAGRVAGMSLSTGCAAGHVALGSMTDSANSQSAAKVGNKLSCRCSNQGPGLVLLWCRECTWRYRKAPISPSLSPFVIFHHGCIAPAEKRPTPWKCPISDGARQRRQPGLGSHRMMVGYSMPHHLPTLTVCPVEVELSPIGDKQ